MCSMCRKTQILDFFKELNSSVHTILVRAGVDLELLADEMAGFDKSGSGNHCQMMFGSGQ